MALIHLAPDADPTVCPACDGRDLSTPYRGRHTGKWFRHCRAPRCATTLVLDGPPTEIQAQRPIRGWLRGQLPIDEALPELPASTQGRMTPARALAQQVERALDARERQMARDAS